MISRGVKDPRLAGLITVTQVETSNDLRHARVYVSVLGSPEEKEEAMRGAASASGFMRHELSGRLNLKYVPDLTFVLDQAFDDAQQIYRLMDQVAGHPGGDSRESGQQK